MITPGLRDTIKWAGFVPPAEIFTKVDPRGYEYGKFVVEVEAEDVVSVRSVDLDGHERYAMTMTENSFKRWAKECT
jgi:hypothetical protein